MTFFGLVGLLFLIYIKPQAIEPALAVVQPLRLFFGIIVLGILMDLNARRSRLIAPPPEPSCPANLGQQSGRTEAGRTT